MEGANIPFSKMLVIILPGGVSHALGGFCMAIIIIPVMPITPLNVKNPPFIRRFITRSSSFFITPQQHLGAAQYHQSYLLAKWEDSYCTKVSGR